MAYLLQEFLDGFVRIYVPRSIKKLEILFKFPQNCLVLWQRKAFWQSRTFTDSLIMPSTWHNDWCPKTKGTELADWQKRVSQVNRNPVCAAGMTKNNESFVDLPTKSGTLFLSVRDYLDSRSLTVITFLTGGTMTEIIFNSQEWGMIRYYSRLLT